MADEFDVVVIGAGPPGENAAGRCADQGMSTAIVEKSLVGGTCTYWGCIPSKALIRPGDAVAAARRAPGAAKAVTGAIDVEAAFAQRDYMTSSWDDTGALQWLDDEGITLVRGHGRLAGELGVEVDIRDDGTRRLTARRAVVLANGTTALIPPIEGLREASPWDNKTATEAKSVPGRLLVLGGGPIGSELAQAFHRLGADSVTVIEAGPRLLSREEPFAGEEVRAGFEAEGIEVVTGNRMTRAGRTGAAGPVTASLEDGRILDGEEILVAVGRRPNTSDLGLATIGLQDLEGEYLPVDRRLRVEGAGGDWLYSVGDINGLAPFTHMGKYQGRLVGDVIAGKDVEDIADHGIVPRVTFTDPQVGAVGLTEAQAREQGLEIRVIDHPIGNVAGTYLLGNGISGTARIVVDESRRVIVGATFTGPGIQELVYGATVAIAGEVTLDTLWHAVPAFPTVSEVWLRLLETYGL